MQGVCYDLQESTGETRYILWTYEYALSLKFKEKAELIFGAPLGEELVTLLSNHFINLQILVNALKSGDQNTVDGTG